MREQENWGGMPYERMIAVLRYRGLDAEAVRVAQERQLATLREAAEMMSKTMQEIGNRQATLLRETMERMMGSLSGANGDASVTGLTRRQMDASRAQIEAQVAAFRAIADLMWDCGRNAFDLMQRTMSEHVETVEKGSGRGEPEAAPSPGRQVARVAKPKRRSD